MKRSLSIWFGTLAPLVLGAASLGALAQQAAPVQGSSLPSAQPTGGAGQPAAAPQAAEPRVVVSYTDGKLAVEATNASLNEILRQVSLKAGIKITGGVADDRVFGKYGPAAPAVVLDELLDGTGSNMLLLDSPGGGSELVLTPRHGGVTPPNPNAATQTNEAEENSGGYVPPVRPYQPPTAASRGGFGAGPDARAGIPLSAPGSDPSGGSKTPQEIYEQLQQTMQQQRRLNAPAQ